MIAWLPVAIWAASRAMVRLISATAAIWYDRVHAKSNCAQISAAAANDVILCERRKDGSTLVIIPRCFLGEDQGLATALVKRSSQEMPPP